MPESLTPAEARALLAFAIHGGYQQAADAIGCKPDTVRAHLRSVRSKLQVPTTVQAFYVAVRTGTVVVSGEDAA